jgi:uncharacterized protein
MGMKEVRTTSASATLAAPAHSTKHTSGPRLVGYAAPFNSLSHDLGGFRERILFGAFADSVKRRDVLGLFSHNYDSPLARTKNGSLQLVEDRHGLKFSMQLPDTTLARDVAALVEARTLVSMSFGFTVPTDGDDWHREDGQTIRTLLKVKLFEISIVAEPAYEQTSVSLKRALDALDSAIAEALNDRRRRLEALCA